MIRIFGTMTDPSGSPVPGAIIELRAISSTNEVLLGSAAIHKCDQQGAYSFQLAAGMYDAYAQNDRCGDMDYIGTAKVSANSVDGDLYSILIDGGINITPPMLDSALAAALRAESAASLTAADRVSAGQSAEHARADSVAAQSAKNMSVAAADTAAQKAASAATHDASAQDAAARAENAASAVVGAVLDGGECDLSIGVYPQPLTVAGKKYSTIWYVAVSGTVSGTSYDVGDILRYTTAKTGYYFKVDAKDEVYSVNGEKGAVTITPQKIGAETAGLANQLVDQHAAKPSAHPISGVSGLMAALDAKPSRNILINGEVTRINQRNFSGDWSTLSLGAYGYDRWKKSGPTAMAQIIEAGNFIPGEKYILSGTGVVTTQLTAPASGNWTIEVSQTARNVQLELGTVTTPFEIRNIQHELAMCQRFYQVGEGWLYGYGAAGALAQTYIPFKVTMRAVPNAYTEYVTSNFANVTGTTNVTVTINGIKIGDTIVATGAGFAWLKFTVSSEL